LRGENEKQPVQLKFLARSLCHEQMTEMNRIK